MNASLPLGAGGERQSPQDYVAMLSATSGLPHVMCRRNMEKIHAVFTQMPTILRGLTRGLDPAVIDDAVAEHDGMPLSFASAGAAMGGMDCTPEEPVPITPTRRPVKSTPSCGHWPVW